MRNFGSEQVSFTANIFSESAILSQEEINAQIEQIHGFIEKAFTKCLDREISEKEVLIEYSGKKRDAVAKYDEALKQEMETTRLAQQTMKEAEKQSRKNK